MSFWSMFGSPHQPFVEGCTCSSCKYKAYLREEERKHAEGVMQEAQRLISFEGDLIISENADAMFKSHLPIGKMSYGTQKSKEVPDR